jgi:acyl-CoA synthetase (AMP-forming)/AMP-acid ligase II
MKITIAGKSDNFVDLLVKQSDQYGDKTVYAFLGDGDNVTETMSYSLLCARAKATAVMLGHRYSAGSRILLLYPSCIDYMVAFYGCLCAGMIAVPAFSLRGRKRNARLEAVIHDCGANAAMTTSLQANLMQEALEASPIMSDLEIICSDLIDIRTAKDWQRPEVNGETPAFLQYTSGSTGKTKGVIINHRNLIENERMLQAAFRTDSETVCIAWAPIFHDMGLIGFMLHTLWLGATCYFMAPAYFLQRPIRWLQAITRFCGTLTGGPNFAYQLCVDRIREEDTHDLDLTSLKVAFNGSEPVRYTTIKKFSEKFTRVGFKEQAMMPCYGMAETTLIITGGNKNKKPTVLYVDNEMMGHSIVSPVDSTKGIPLIGCGENLLEQKICIVDPSNGKLCQPNQIGEIWIAGPHVSRGYWMQTDISQDTFQAYTANTNDGPFLRTGDLGFLLKNELFISGRIKDIMIVQGVNYYPQDVEATVEDTDIAINPAGSAAFAIKDNLGDCVVVAVEVKRSYIRKINHRMLKGQLRQNVLEQHDLALADIVLIRQHALPKTSSGKVMRSQVRRLYQTGGLVSLNVATKLEGLNHGRS